MTTNTNTRDVDPEDFLMDYLFGACECGLPGDGPRMVNADGGWRQLWVIHEPCRTRWIAYEVSETLDAAPDVTVLAPYREIEGTHPPWLVEAFARHNERLEMEMREEQEQTPTPPRGRG